MNVRHISPILCFLLLAGCSDDGSEPDRADIATTPLAGLVGGQAWSLMSAASDAFLSDEDAFWVDAYGESVSEPCSGFVNATLPHMILTVPKAVGNHALGLSLTATFVLNDAAQSNLVATRGSIQVEALTETQITGGAFIEYDDDNSVNGRFTVNICPE